MDLQDQPIPFRWYMPKYTSFIHHLFHMPKFSTIFLPTKLVHFVGHWVWLFMLNPKWVLHAIFFVYSQFSRQLYPFCFFFISKKLCVLVVFVVSSKSSQTEFPIVYKLAYSEHCRCNLMLHMGHISMKYFCHKIQQKHCSSHLYCVVLFVPLILFSSIGNILDTSYRKVREYAISIIYASIFSECCCAIGINCI